MKKLLSISVMAHEARSHWFQYLSDKLDNPPFSVDKIDGPGHIGVWENCKRAWQMHDPEAEFHVVIQDDAIVCESFRERAEAFIEKYKHTDNFGKYDRAFNFYFGNKMITKGLALEGLKNGFAVKEAISWGVAICLPVAIIPEMIRVCDTYKNPQDDVRITKFLRRKKIVAYYPMPSLIDHRRGQSLVGDPGMFRSAFKFIDGNQHGD